jgi:hypothetical protein
MLDNCWGWFAGAGTQPASPIYSLGGEVIKLDMLDASGGSRARDDVARQGQRTLQQIGQ